MWSIRRGSQNVLPRGKGALLLSFLLVRVRMRRFLALPIALFPSVAFGAAYFGLRLIPRDGEASAAYFRYDLAPGEHKTDRFVITNTSEEPLDLVFYPADAWNNESGDLVGGTIADTPTAVGSWVTLEKKNATLESGKSAEVEFTLTVPPGTPPGDYFGFVFAEQVLRPDEPDSTTTPSEPKQASFEVKFNVRIAVTLWARVPGDHRVDVQFGEARAEVKGGQLQVVCPLSNRGNLFVKPSVQWTLSGERDPGNPIAFQDPTAQGYILPGQDISIVAPIRTARPLRRGNYLFDVKVDLEVKDHPTQTLQEKFLLTLPPPPRALQAESRP